jgi:hypothetical protein
LEYEKKLILRKSHLKIYIVKFHTFLLEKHSLQAKQLVRPIVITICNIPST